LTEDNIHRSKEFGNRHKQKIVFPIPNVKGPLVPKKVIKYLPFKYKCRPNM